MTTNTQPLRPRDFALLLLASGDLRPRQRARDQQADQIGLELKARMLERMAALDPEPAQMEAALLEIVQALAPPTGPTRAVANTIYEEWQEACRTPEWLAHLLAEAAQAGARDPRSTQAGECERG